MDLTKRSVWQCILASPHRTHPAGNPNLSNCDLTAHLFPRLSGETLSLTFQLALKRCLLDPNGPSAGWKTSCQTERCMIHMCSQPLPHIGLRPTAVFPKHWAVGVWLIHHLRAFRTLKCPPLCCLLLLNCSFHLSPWSPLFLASFYFFPPPSLF